MRISLVGRQPRSLARTLTLEGDEIVGLDQKPDLVLSDGTLREAPCPIIGGDWSVPAIVLQAMNIETVEKNEDFFVSQWFEGDWREQLLVGLPVRGMMNEGLGKDVVTGLACRYVKDSPLKELFDNSRLVATLREMKYTGFVSFGLVLGEDRDFEVCYVQTGLPHAGLYNVIEGVSGKITDYFTSVGQLLRESWTVGLMLSRHPFPVYDKGERVSLDGITADVLKHLWLQETAQTRSVVTTQETLVGYSTAWSLSLSEANRRALRTLRTIRLPQKQFRTDIAAEASMSWALLADAGLAGS